MSGMSTPPVEDDAQASMRLLRQAIGASTAGLALLDATGRVLQANAAFRTVMAWPDGTGLGHDLPSAVRSGERQALADTLAGVAAAGRSAEVAIRPLAAAASLPPVVLSIAPLFEAGGLAGLLVTAGDTAGQRAATQALQDSEDRYQALFRSMDTGFCVIRMLFDEQGTPHDYRFLEINPAFERHTGLGEAVIGRRIREIAPGHEQHWFDVYGRVALTGEAVRYENHAGQIQDRWFEVHAFRIGPADRHRVAVLFTDITARKQAEAAMRESEAQFRSFAQAMPHHVWTAPAEGSLDWFNDRMYEYAGMAPGSLDHDGWAAMVHPEDLLPARDSWLAARAAGDDWEREFRLRRHDGAWRWHLSRAVPIRDPQGGVRRWIGTNTDIHEQRTLREQLTRLNASLESEVEQRTRERDRVWQLSPDLLTRASLDGRLLAVNPAWTRVLGHDEASLLSRPFWELIHPESMSVCETAVHTLQQGRSVRVQARILGTGGTVRWFDWVATPSGDEFYAMARDITDAMQRQADLEQAQAALRQAQKMEAVGQLTGGIAHDFSNLLQVISGNLQLLQRQVAGQERLEQRLASAQDAVRRGARLSGQLLAFGRRQALDPKPVNIGRFVVEMTDMLRRAIGEAIEIRTVVPAGLWNTFIDPVQIESAILNLAINARDAMDRRGRLTISLENVRLDEADERRHPEGRAGEYVLLSVADTGCGMPPELMEQVFEPFFSTKPPGSGTGLGLSMVYGFVKQSGGHIRIDSAIGAGTTMHLFLPRTLQQDTPAPEAPARTLQGGGETVLVVEDDPAVRSTVADLLLDLGYRVLSAGSAAEALASVEGGAAVDLLLTDVVMPGEPKSPELARRARERLPRLAVLFTSGYAADAFVHGGRLDEGVELLAKPYGRDELARRLRGLLDGPR